VTEAEWLACKEAGELLRFLRDHEAASDRKLRLFGCACCPLVWWLVPDDRAKRGIESSEGWADVEPKKKDEEAAREFDDVGGESLGAGGDLALMAVQCVVGTLRTISSAIGPVTPATRLAPKWVARQLARLGRRAAGQSDPAQDEVIHADQLHLIHVIVGNPFRRADLNPFWRTPEVSALALAAYDERFLPSGHRDPARLAVLSDALEEAGCADADVLAHLRSPGPHVRGCWALDLVLGNG